MPLSRSHRDPRAGAPPDPDDRDAAEAVARRLLATTDRSRVELERRLERRGFTAGCAAGALDRLEARGWLDDARMAEDLAQRRLRRGYGRRRVIADLAARGVAADTVTLAARSVAEAQAEAARAAAERLRPHPLGALSDREYRRLAAALARRGFDTADIRAALRQIAGEETAPGPGGD